MTALKFGDDLDERIGGAKPHSSAGSKHLVEFMGKGMVDGPLNGTMPFKCAVARKAQLKRGVPFPPGALVWSGCFHCCARITKA
jgi:hypothetical protein